MSTSFNDAQFSAMAPATSESTGQSRTLTTSSSAITLPGGGTYDLHLDAASGMAYCRLGADAPTLPSDGSTATTGFWLAPGVPKALEIQASIALRALMTAGTGTIYITRLR